jgi:RimJ/RimL family protein N-acetyltransferase
MERLAPQISVRLAEESDYERIVDYFLSGDDAFLAGMGVDRSKLPPRTQWLKLLKENHRAELEEKSFFYVVWELNSQAVGHSNINKIVFGQEAYTHLHMWKPDIRQSGLGYEFMRLSIPYYFNLFALRYLYCEPYSLNAAPNQTLKKLGFEFIRQYETVPGWISFPQPVNRWSLARQAFGNSGT